MAQAVALVPGVSRGGATLAAARLRGFTRPAAHRLSRRVSLPVIGGATLLKAVRLGRRRLARRELAPFAAGAGMAFVSGLLSVRALDRDGPLWPFAAYRMGLAAVIVRRLGLTSGRSSTMRS
jgi:undecaprenyl-diphosphatase